MRNVKFAIGEHYHLFSRGDQKQTIFFDESDYVRFMFLILYFQSSLSPREHGKKISYFKKHGAFNVYKNTTKLIAEQRKINVVNFCIMPNHFHVTVEEVIDGGISKYMHRVLTSYAKYFCAKYKRTGHVFESTFKAVRVTTNTQLLHLSSYIHRNPREFKEWRGKEHAYPWSSLMDYTGENRWGDLLKKEIVSGQFDSAEGYKNFVDTSTAKKFEEILPFDHLFLDEA